ncbi:MAG: hypothetical protein ACOX0X_00770 [Candidatus Dojkabacteria bacterium]
MKKYLLLIPFILIIISICLLGLEKQYMWSDEVFSFHAAKMIIEKGEAVYDSGLIYGRAPIYHHLLAYSMKIFGVNEFGSRILNIPFWLGTSTVIFLFVKEAITFIKGEKRYMTALSVSLFYLISNFAIAMLRETRMYGMSTFFLILATYLLYKAIINPQKRYKIFNIEVDIRYAIAFLPIMYIAYNTQPINILLGLGIAIYYLLSGFLHKQRSNFLIFVLLILAGLGLMYLRYDSLNIVNVFSELSPDWAKSANIPYYSFLTVRNLPIVVVALVATLYILYKKRDRTILLLTSIILGFLTFLSLQPAQQERYWQAVIPLIVILSFLSIFLATKEIKASNLKKVLIATTVLSLLVHLPLSIKEIVEIDTYTKSSLSIHKKLEYNKLSSYLKNNLKDEEILIADSHSAYTLYAKGFDVDFLLLPDDSVDWRWEEKDIYFNIPLINDDQLDSLLEQEKDGFLVVRDPEGLKKIEYSRVPTFNRPTLYRF